MALRPVHRRRCIYCSPVVFAPLLYSASLHVAGDTGNFEVSGLKLAKYFKVKPRNIYAAAELLVASGFWVPTEVSKGKPTKYRPVGHKDWAEKHPGFCTKKVEHLFADEDELGRKLGCGIGKLLPNAVKTFRRTGATDDQILEAAKQFMEADAGHGDRGRRQRFLAFLRERHTGHVCP